MVFEAMPDLVPLLVSLITSLNKNDLRLLHIYLFILCLLTRI